MKHTNTHTFASRQDCAGKALSHPEQVGGGNGKRVQEIPDRLAALYANAIHKEVGTRMLQRTRVSAGVDAQDLDPQALLIASLQKEVEELKKKLRADAAPAVPPADSAAGGAEEGGEGRMRS